MSDTKFTGHGVLLPEIVRKLTEILEAPALGRIVKGYVTSDPSCGENSAEVSLITTLLAEGCKMADSYERKKEASRIRKQRSRAVSRTVTPCHAQSREEKSSVVKSTEQYPAQDNTTNKKPSPRPRPNNTDLGLDSVDLSRIDLSDEAFFSGQDPILMTAKLTGETDVATRKAWRSKLKKLGPDGETKYLEELFAFKRELAAGEDVRNRPAAWTARLNKLR